MILNLKMMIIVIVSALLKVTCLQFSGCEVQQLFTGELLVNKWHRNYEVEVLGHSNDVIM